jgi:hypothetical protein
MNRENFITAIVGLRDSCVESITKKLLKPAGRKPRSSILALSSFYNNLDSDQKLAVENLTKEAIDQALFSFLCILDHVSFIEDSEEKTVFELYATKNGEKVLLNPFEGEELHDLYNSLVLTEE